ncbi:hypothetical protein F5884DRAFT_307991 [Xylogone sp. PMI_703]|nr:hypothetical protein F5884DRAFT_307991 [Xylogone sp. PMI_703]
MSSSATDLTSFKGAMDYVYGPLPVNVGDTESWTPPPKAGGFKGRYLWTDAFGVVNFITLNKETGEDKYISMAKKLVETVHDIQGHTRDGKSRLPGATDENPLGGGLRIGKEEASGPDGDGQYHHYLTLWMFALNRLSVATKEPLYNTQAIQLAKAIHDPFFVGKDTGHPRMVWKIAMDMSKPLVASQGNLDPIDGYITMKILKASAQKDDPALDDEIHDYQRVMERKGKKFVSTDMLDLGMSLWSAHWLWDKEEWAADLQRQCLKQVSNLFSGGTHLRELHHYRLAFRDFGACMGIKCSAGADDVLTGYAQDLIKKWEMALAATPDELRPITQVMYAAALIPGAFQRGWIHGDPDL